MDFIMTLQEEKGTQIQNIKEENEGKAEEEEEGKGEKIRKGGRGGNVAIYKNCSAEKKKEINAYQPGEQSGSGD